MSDEELLGLCRQEEKKLRQGKGMTMSIPPSIYDTDLLLHELFRRFESHCNIIDLHRKGTEPNI